MRKHPSIYPCNGLKEAMRPLFQRICRSAVHVMNPNKGDATGIVLSARPTVILTAWHIVDNSGGMVYIQRLNLDWKTARTRPVGKPLPASVVFADPSRDTAVLLASEDLPLVRPASIDLEGQLADFAPLYRLGCDVMPLSAGRLLTQDDRDESGVLCLTASIPLEGGASGGPLCDKRGYVIGMVVAGSDNQYEPDVTIALSIYILMTTILADKDIAGLLKKRYRFSVERK